MEKPYKLVHSMGRTKIRLQYFPKREAIEYTISSPGLASYKCQIDKKFYEEHYGNTLSIYSAMLWLIVILSKNNLNNSPEKKDEDK